LGPGAGVSAVNGVMLRQRCWPLIGEKVVNVLKVLFFLFIVGSSDFY
jgi:hypothetical protein